MKRYTAIAAGSSERINPKRVTILTLKNISKSFGIDEVLKDVSFTVTDKSILGLVGSNGAGKTTLLRIITGEQPVRFRQYNHALVCAGIVS